MAKNRQNKQNKQPKAEHVPGGGKTPRTGITPGDTNKVPRAGSIPYAEYPSWRLGRMELSGPWAWTAAKLTADDFGRVFDRLCQFETMTWKEILQEGGKQNHPIEIHRLCKEAQERLVTLKLDDVDSVISLRLEKRAVS
jgi:hypothetical protein